VSAYVDTSALLKLYFDEPDTRECRRLLRSEVDLATSMLTLVEARRRIALHLDPQARERARREFQHDWENMDVVRLSDEIVERGAEIAEATGVRTLDAVHLGAAERVSDRVITYDRRQADAARALGFTVLGA